MASTVISVDKQFNDLIEQAANHWPSNTDKCVDWVWSQLQANPSLLKAIIEDLVRRQIKATLNDRKHHLKSAMKYTPKGVSSRVGRIRVQVANRVAMVNMLSNWTISTGATLSNATREDLLAEARREREVASGHNKVADFYQDLAGKLKPKQTVGKRFSANQLKKIWELYR
jgi:hypothetical protein